MRAAGAIFAIYGQNTYLKRVGGRENFENAPQGGRPHGGVARSDDPKFNFAQIRKSDFFPSDPNPKLVRQFFCSKIGRRDFSRGFWG